MSASEVRFPNEYESKLEARIRELEAQLVSLERLEQHIMNIEDLEQRIAKAKKLLEIIQAALVETDAPIIKFGIKDALAALEGK